MILRKNQKVELLAPAGTLEVFQTAVRAGADAIYIGAPALNARALAKRFEWPQIGAMIKYAHQHQVKVYIAMNSLVKEEELSLAVETLAHLDALQADALILQDLGLFHLAKTYFPQLRLHASTLLGAHNSAIVKQFEKMGFDRVVLARELTLEEIGKIRQESSVELETFIHGALCYSYSGLCLFSSFLGGKSSLRGRCVQPCRRRYFWGAKGKRGASGYFFSMSDLESAEILPSLLKQGVSSLKIEGRMRSAQYVGSVVSAYRLLLDHPADQQAGQEASGLLNHAMGRKTTAGYFLTSQPKNVLAPQHSGNVGLFLGKVKNTDNSIASLRLNNKVKLGDRLRLHHERSGERTPFTLKEMWRGSKAISEAPAKTFIQINTNTAVAVGDSIYRVDIKESRFAAGQDKLVPMAAGSLRKLVDFNEVQRITKRISPQRPKGLQGKEKAGKGQFQKRKIDFTRGRRGKQTTPISLPLWVRVDDFKEVRFLPAARINRLIVELSPKTFPAFLKIQKHLRPFLQLLVWALPPVIEENSLPFYRQSITALWQKGFHAWQISHIGQLSLFSGKKNVDLAGDFTLNALNSLTVAFLAEQGLQHIQFSIESDRVNLQAALARKRNMRIGIMLYGRPPLFTARLSPGYFRFKQPFISPKGEKFILDKRWGQVVALSENIYSLLPWLHELYEMGIGYGVIDCNNLSFRTGTFDTLIRAADRPLRKNQSSFNFNTVLQ